MAQFDEIDTPAEEALADAAVDDAVMPHDNRTILIIASLTAAVLFVVAVVMGWFAYDAYYATPSRSLTGFLGALERGDGNRVESLLTEDLRVDLDDLDAGSTIDAIVEGCGLSVAQQDLERATLEGRRAIYRAVDDDATTTIVLVKTGYGRWAVDEIRSATVETVTEPVPAPPGGSASEFVDTPYLAQGTTVQMTEGVEGEADITYEIPLVNGSPGEREEISRSVTVEPVSPRMWRGTGAPDDSGTRVYEIEVGTGWVDGEPGVTTPMQVMPADLDSHLVAFKFEPTPAGTTSRLVWMGPNGEVIEEDLWDPDDSWAWSWVRYAMPGDESKIDPGPWVAAIQINEQPAAYVTFRIE